MKKLLFNYDAHIAIVIIIAALIFGAAGIGQSYRAGREWRYQAQFNQMVGR